jgi:hypothetical protein
MHRKLWPALGAGAIFLATVLNASAAPLDPSASSSRFAGDVAATSNDVVALPYTSLLYQTGYTRLQQFLWQLQAPSYYNEYWGYQPAAGGQVDKLAERAFDY